MNVSVPIVGMAFRPPAARVLNEIPMGAELLLQRQFDNPYDANAIRVLLPGFAPGEAHEEIYKQCLIDALPDDLPAGRNTFNISALSNPLFIGYVAAKSGEAGELAPRMDNKGLTELPARLGTSLEGKPVAIIELSIPEKLEAKPEPEHVIDDEIPF